VVIVAKLSVLTNPGRYYGNVRKIRSLWPIILLYNVFTTLSYNVETLQTFQKCVSSRITNN